MKLFELINILNRSDILLNESMGLPELRRRIIKGEMRLDPNEEDWYRDENNKNELIDTMSRIVGPSSDIELNRELKKFNTSKYTEKGRIVKPESLNNALNLEILRAKNRITDENDNLSSQYEKLNIKKDVEIYSVFTPTANIQLSHKILKNNEEPTWCIASPSGAARMWSHYNLWNAEYPCVFIVIKHGIVNGIRNPKYEIKCNPELTEQFAKGECNISEFIDEIRDARQDEKDLDDTSLFKATGINVQTLESAMRKLMNTEKAYAFSKKYGADFAAHLNKLKNNEQLSSNERIQLLIDACKKGLFERYYQKAKDSEIPFFIDRLIEYKTLGEGILDIYKHSCINAAIGFDTKIFNKIFNYFIKNKACNSYILRYAYELRYPGIDDIYDKIISSILVNNPETLNDIDLEYIKNDWLERYLRSSKPYHIKPYLFLQIIETRRPNLNQIESICKVFFEKGNTLRGLVYALLARNTSYIPIICDIALKLKKIDQKDIIFLYSNYGIDEIRTTIDELNLKITKTIFEPEEVISVIRSAAKNDAVNKDITKSLTLLCKILSKYSRSKLGNNYMESNCLPELSDIIKSDPKGSSEESKIHARIIDAYKQHKLDLRDIYTNCEDLDMLANYNSAREFFSKFCKGHDYYNELINGKSITPYDLYRNMLYNQFMYADSSL